MEGCKFPPRGTELRISTLLQLWQSLRNYPKLARKLSSLGRSYATYEESLLRTIRFRPNSEKAVASSWNRLSHWFPLSAHRSIHNGLLLMRRASALVTLVHPESDFNVLNVVQWQVYYHEETVTTCNRQPNNWFFDKYGTCKHSGKLKNSNDPWYLAQVNI